MPCCARCGSDLPEDDLHCHLCGAGSKEVPSGEEPEAFWKPYVLGMLGILLGAISYYGMFHGLTEDPVGIFIPALGAVFGIQGATTAYVQKDVVGNSTLRIALCAAAAIISGIMFLAYVFV